MNYEAGVTWKDVIKGTALEKIKNARFLKEELRKELRSDHTFVLRYEVDVSDDKVTLESTVEPYLSRRRWPELWEVSVYPKEQAMKMLVAQIQKEGVRIQTDSEESKFYLPESIKSVQFLDR